MECRHTGDRGDWRKPLSLALKHAPEVNEESGCEPPDPARRSSRKLRKFPLAPILHPQGLLSRVLQQFRRREPEHHAVHVLQGP